MNVQIGQVWRDSDPRRAGRTFRVVNIDNDVATCENLTGKGGLKPSVITSFINTNRFTSKYYKLQNGIGTFSTLADDEVAGFQMTSSAVKVIRRQPKASLVQECKNMWPGDWKEAGPFIILNSKNNDFEIIFRQLVEFSKPFEVKVKLYNFIIFNTIVSGDITNAIKKVQDYFLVLNHELQNFMTPQQENFRPGAVG